MRGSLPTQVTLRCTGQCLRLENGNNFIGWGTAETGESGTRVTEVTPEGHIVEGG